MLDFVAKNQFESLDRHRSDDITEVQKSNIEETIVLGSNWKQYTTSDVVE